jgi:hypothetical protein
VRAEAEALLRDEAEEAAYGACQWCPRLSSSTYTIACTSIACTRRAHARRSKPSLHSRTSRARVQGRDPRRRRPLRPLAAYGTVCLGMMASLHVE